MYSVSWSIRAVALLFVLSISGGEAPAQFAKFIRPAADPLPSAGPRLGLAACTRGWETDAAVPHAATPRTDDVGSPCDTPPVSVPPASVLPVNPCTSSSASKMGCVPSGDPVQDDLAEMGKPGEKILRAREKVLEILESENGCSAWFREKDSNSATTFRTVGFTLDSKGQEYVLEIPDRDSRKMLYVPYVAKVFQGEGAHSRVTINRNGAFFFPAAAVVTDRKEGGAMNFLGQRVLRVGPYWGDTGSAQVLAILHEFGHVVDRLPSDGGDMGEKSAENTNEVLRYCRVEVETSGRRGALAAKR